jgi:hypothetical protein
MLNNLEWDQFGTDINNAAETVAGTIVEAVVDAQKAGRDDDDDVRSDIIEHVISAVQKRIDHVDPDNLIDLHDDENNEAIHEDAEDDVKARMDSLHDDDPYIDASDHTGAVASDVIVEVIKLLERHEGRSVDDLLFDLRISHAVFG